MVTLRERVQSYREIKTMGVADANLEKILGTESSRKALLEAAYTNDKKDAEINKLFDEYDAAVKTGNLSKQAELKRKIDKASALPTENEGMLDQAFDAFLSGKAEEKTKVAQKFLTDDLLDPRNTLKNAEEVLSSIQNHQKADAALAKKAALVLVYGQLYGMGGVISKKECDEHNQILTEKRQVEALWKSVLRGRKRTQ